MRNNEERLGAPQRASMPSPAISIPTESKDKEFNFAVPTELVELPSKGFFYLEGHVLHERDYLEIRYMTAKDEDVLTNKSLIKKGVVLERFLQNLVMDKNVKVDDLTVGDKNALLIAARITGYGEHYSTKVACPTCQNAVEFSFNLEEAKKVVSIDQINQEDFLKERNAEVTEDKTFLVMLPKTKYVVEVKVLTGKDEKKLRFVEKKMKGNKQQEATLTRQLKMMVVSVNKNKDFSVISKVVDSLPAYDSRHLRKVYSEIVPDVVLKQDFICDICTMEEEVEVPLTTEFFWPK